VVTLDGNPVPDATVRFYPDAGTDPNSSGYAQTGTDGKFVVTVERTRRAWSPGSTR